MIVYVQLRGIPKELLFGSNRGFPQIPDVISNAVHAVCHYWCPCFAEKKYWLWRGWFSCIFSGLFTCELKVKGKRQVDITIFLNCLERCQIKRKFCWISHIAYWANRNTSPINWFLRNVLSVWILWMVTLSAYLIGDYSIDRYSLIKLSITCTCRLFKLFLTRF